MTTLVTGANGFIGFSLCSKLRRDASSVRGAVRRPNSQTSSVGDVAVGSISSDTDWTSALRNVVQVVHLAAQVHELIDKNLDSLAELRRVNVEATANLVRQAATARVRRFVFLSSIKVNGEFTKKMRQPFTADDIPTPVGSYGISKYEAEQVIRQIAAETGMEVVIIRPPLVYGPGVKGNFASMVRWIQKGIPLPLGAIHNQRSLVALDNLVDFIALCSDRKRSPNAANEVFLISDGVDVSTPELLRKVARAYGVKAHLLPVPERWMRFAAGLVGKSAVADRLLNSLVVDSSKARELLGWKPVVSMDEQLQKMAWHDTHI